MQTMLASVTQVTTSSVEALRRVHEQQERVQPRKHEQSREVSSEKPKVPFSSPKKEEPLDPDDNLGQLLKRKRERGDQGGDI